MGELGAIYEETRARIAEMVRNADAGTEVPACPEWSVGDLVAHMTGNCSDIIAGNIDGAATPEWTARQVAQRKGRPLAEVLSEWDGAAPQVAPLLDDFPGRYGQMLVADIVSHEHDLRGALARPGARDSAGVSVALDFLVPVFLGTGTTVLGLDPLEVRAGSRQWIAGSSGPATGDVDSWRDALMPDEETSQNGATPGARLSAEPFELMRSVAGRRSAAQIRRLEWNVDPEPYLPIFGFGPFEVRPSDLIE